MGVIDNHFDRLNDRLRQAAPLLKLRRKELVNNKQNFQQSLRQAAPLLKLRRKQSVNDLDKTSTLNFQLQTVNPGLNQTNQIF